MDPIIIDLIASHQFDLLKNFDLFDMDKIFRDYLLPDLLKCTDNDIINHVIDRLIPIKSDLLRSCFLHIACRTNSVVFIKILVRERFPLNIKDGYGYYPLHYACQYSSLVVVQFLIENGADIFCMSDKNTYPIVNSMINSNLEIFQHLFELYIYNQNYQNHQINCSEQILNYLALNPKILIIKFLLDKKFDFGAKIGLNGRTIYHYLSLGEFHEEINLLICNGFDPNIADINGVAPIHLSTSNTSDSVLRVLLKNGTNFECRDEDGETPIHYACRYLSLSNIKCLAEFGSNINSRDKNGHTICHYCCHQYFGVVRENSTDIQENRINRINIIKFLIDQKADFEMADNSMVRPLHYACSDNDPSVVECLLNNGISIDSADANGKKAIHYACIRSNSEVVAVLLDAGANPTEKDSMGLNAIQYTWLNNNSCPLTNCFGKPIPNILTYFRQKGIDVDIHKDHIMIIHNSHKIDYDTLTNEDFICPISRCYFLEPVFAADKKFYEKTCIESWLEKNTISPFTGKEMKTLDIMVDLKFGQTLQNFYKFNPQYLVEQFKVSIPEKISILIRNKEYSGLLQFSEFDFRMIDSDLVDKLFECSDLNIVKHVFNHSLNLNCAEHKNILFNACYGSVPEHVQLLIDSGVSIEGNDGGNNVAHIACMKYPFDQNLDFEIVKILIKANAAFDEISNTGLTAVQMLIPLLSLENFKYLIKFGFGSNTNFSPFDRSHVINIARVKNQELLKFMIENGVLKNTLIVFDLIKIACEYLDQDLINILEKNSINFTERDEFGRTAIHYLCINSMHRPGPTDKLDKNIRNKILDMIKFFVEKRTNYLAEDKIGRRPIDYACTFSDLKIIKYLAEKGAEIHTANSQGNMPIHFACQNYSVKIIKYFDKLGFNLEVENSISKIRPVHHACIYPNIEVFKYLASRNVDLEAADIVKMRPIHHACAFKNIQVIQYLLEHKVNINCLDLDGRKPIDCVINENITDDDSYDDSYDEQVSYIYYLFEQNQT